MAELGYAMYDVTRRYIEHIVEPIPNVKVSMIGGIQINVHKPCGDLFAPLMFEVREKGKPTKDLLHTFTEIQQYDWSEIRTSITLRVLLTAHANSLS